MYYNKYIDAKDDFLAGKLGVMPTDTVYGVVGSAFNERLTERVFNLKGRDSSKPMIMLIADVSDLKNYYDLELDDDQLAFTKKHWPGRVSLVFAAPSTLPDYIHRGYNSVVLRIPDDEDLRVLIREVGPIFATSANVSGEKNVSNIKEAHELFGDEVDFYIDGPELLGKPSKIFSLEYKPYKQLR